MDGWRIDGVSHNEGASAAFSIWESSVPLVGRIFNLIYIEIVTVTREFVGGREAGFAIGGITTVGAALG